MSAHRQDDILRYTVDSRSRAGVTHVVELDLYDGNGGCTCEHFSFKLEEHLKKGAKPQDRLRCKHIHESRAALVDDIIAATIANRKKKPKKR